MDENSDIYSNSDNEKSYQEISSSNEADDEWKNKENNVKARHPSNYSLEFMKEVIAYADETNASGKRRRSWKTVRNRYKSIPAKNYTARFRNYIPHQGTKRQKINNVDEYVYKKFLNAREKFLPVHDIDVCRWGLQAAKQYKVENFRALSFWLLRFKTRHSIYSRRITNIGTRREVENDEVVQKSEIQFLKEYNSLKSKYFSHEILNTDQVRVEKGIFNSFFIFSRRKEDIHVGKVQTCYHTLLYATTNHLWKSCWSHSTFFAGTSRKNG